MNVRLAEHFERTATGLACTLVLTLASVSSAQGLIYVDASDGFGGPANVSPIASFALSNAQDDLWGLREGFGAEVGGQAYIWEASGTSSGSGQEDAPEVTQTISGLTPGVQYDTYAVYWSATGATQNWTIRTGVNSGSLAAYDRAGALPGATAGSVAAGLIWDSEPTSGGNPVFAEGDRVMYLGLAGTVTANPSGEATVYIDDLPSQSESLNRTWYDGVAYAPAGTSINIFDVTIDRTDGSLTITSNADTPISAVNITSASGSLNPTGWSPVAGNLDNGNGFDDEAWEITSTTVFSLAENETVIDPEIGVDGAVIGPGGGLQTLSPGAVWNASPFEDVVVTVTLPELGFSFGVPAEFVGGTPILQGDFDTDGDVDVTDYAFILGRLGQDASVANSPLEAYAFADLNSDGTTDFFDMAEFRAFYDAANGSGSFALLVPEPTSLALLGCFVVFGLRGRLAVRSCCLILLGAMIGFQGEVQAQAVTYVDADLSNTTLNGAPLVVGGNIVGNRTNDDLWAFETNATFGTNGNSVFAAGGGEDAAGTLATSVSGLPASATGFYDVWAFYWLADTFTWDISASANGGPTVNAGGITGLGGGFVGIDAEDLTYTVDPSFSGGNRQLAAAYLGEVSGSSISVAVDDFTGEGGSQRTWFDGIGYAAAPERVTLEVNTATGEVTLTNPTSSAVSFSYYELQSATGSLNPGGWNSLDDQNLDAVDRDGSGTAGDSLLEGWDEAGTPSLDGDFNADGSVDAADYTIWRDNNGATDDAVLNGNGDSTPGVGVGDYTLWADNYGATPVGSGDSSLLSEVNFFEESTLVSGAAISLGSSFDAIGGSQDLTFAYGTIDGGDQLFNARVVYTTSATSVPEPSGIGLAAALLACGARRRRSA